MKVLITGGAGYVGSVLVDNWMHAFNDEVTVVDSFVHGQNSLAAHCHRKNFHVVNGDARDTRTLDPLLKDADVIIPLAAIVGAPACARDEATAWSTNYDQIVHIVRRASKEQCIIFPTTNSGYGAFGGECDEDTPLSPVSVYGRTKVNAERKVLEAGNGVSLRLATVFGASPRMRLDLLVNDFVYRAVVDRAVVLFESHFTRNYLHVRDAGYAFCFAIDHFEKMRGQAYNVGDSRVNLTKAELCERIKQQLTDFVYVDAPTGEDPDKRNYVVNNTKIETLGWRPYYSLDDGIQELSKLYETLRVREHRNA